MTEEAEPRGDAGEGDVPSADALAPDAAAPEQERAGASVPPTRAEHAARRLAGGRALGGNATVPPGQKPALAAQVTTNRPVAQPTPSKAPTTGPTRDDVYAARRGLVGGKTQETKATPKPAKKAAASNRLIVFGGGGLLVAALLVAGGLYAKRALYAGSDEGRVRGQLVAWELGPRDVAAREASFAQIDALPHGAKTAVALLSDPETISSSGSHSTKSVREVANSYLLHLAAKLKVEPPPAAADVSRLLHDGAAPTAEQWRALQSAWTTWLGDVQAKGLLPKA